MTQAWTPNSILGRDFRRAAFHGFDPDDVALFKRELATFVQDTLRTRDEQFQINQQLRMDLESRTDELHRTMQTMSELRVQLEEFQGIEREIRSALVTAQKSSHETVGAAQLQADRLFQAAKADAERLVDDALTTADKVRNAMEQERADARVYTEQLVEDANRQAQKLINDAQLEADRITQNHEIKIHAENERYQSLLADNEVLEAHRANLLERIEGVVLKVQENNMMMLQLLEDKAPRRVREKVV